MSNGYVHQKHHSILRDKIQTPKNRLFAYLSEHVGYYVYLVGSQLHDYSAAVSLCSESCPTQAKLG